jgi:thioesterase domain-containing protein
MEHAMTADELTLFLRHSIPLLAAVDVRVRVCTPERVVLAAPLAANRNHHQTAFGGSLALMSILSGWALVHVGLAAERLDARLVVQRSECRFDRPVDGELLAEALRPAESWDRFVDTLRRRGKGRIDLQSRVLAEAGDAVLHDATFAASIHRASRPS